MTQLPAFFTAVPAISDLPCYIYQNYQMKLRTFLLNTVLVAAVSITGCDKDKDDNGGDSETKTNITAASWKISAATAMGTDILGFVDACYLDNRVTFRDDLTGNVDEQADVCSPTTAGEFTWTLNTAETEMTLSTSLVPGGNNTFKIVSASSTTLVLSQVTTIPPAPVPLEIVVTLTHP
ncbi:MAG: hypothetical protein EOO09_16175 [Chitinophagaceae bacterium]|nr:MAG: hypothetical protein EOO09_16175 [Chitinophagaceae bacterium]